MFKVILLFSIFLCSSLINYASAPSLTPKEESKPSGLIKLADEAILRKRLSDDGFDYFMEKTNIVQTLAGQVKYPLGVAVAVETALYDFDQYLKQPMTSMLMQMRKPQLIRCLLQDHPDAVESLKKDGLLK